MFTLMKLLAIPSILAGMVLGCVMYALSLAELDVKANGNDMVACEGVRVVQAAAIANMPICKPTVGKMKRRKK